ncbi:hypothetical protein [Paenibacillus protaetiae]|uniref:Uncharacterized protein n=1 Tax=Paenibacillus protaetiae TaxID=2509456 RepID=A0A4P6EVI0_9BACL|nr:hypothetical protein [Paenibacillus protaetiae]QAY66545.1 hypothetical protein ET464_09170 [Paenibacillus protaetiae]
MASRKAPKKREPKGRLHAVKEANRLIGQPVCVVLGDGNCYVGTVKAIHDHKLSLAESRHCGRISLSNRSKTPEVQVSGILDSLIGGIGALNSFGSMATNLFKPMFSGQPEPAGAGGAGDSAAAEGPSIASGPAGGGQPGGGFGSFKQFMPTLQVGMNMVKTIMPLMGMFKI